MDPQTTEKKPAKDLLNQPIEDSDEKKSSPDKLDKDWDRLQDEWKRLDEKQKQYLQKLTPSDNGTAIQEPLETKPSVDDLEKKLAEYEEKTKELDSMQETTAKTNPPAELPGDIKNKEGPKPNQDTVKLKTAQKIVPIKSILGGYKELFKAKPTPAQEKPQEMADAEKQKPKEEVIQAAAEKVSTSAESPDMWDGIPVPKEEPPLKLKKKPGIMEKMKLLKYPVSVMLIDKIDGKKTIEQIILEIKVTPAEAAKGLEILKKEGYV